VYNIDFYLPHEIDKDYPKKFRLLGGMLYMLMKIASLFISSNKKRGYHSLSDFYS